MAIILRSIRSMRGLPIAVAAMLLAGVVGACSPTPEDVLQDVGRSIVAGDILGFEALVDLDGLAASIASDSALLVPQIKEWLKIGLDEKRVASSAVTLFLAVNDVLVDKDFDGTRIFRELGPVQVQGKRALAPITIAHPFAESESVELSVELARSAEGWRVVGIRGLSSLAEILNQPTPEALVRSELRNVASWEEIHYADVYRYSSELAEIDFTPREGLSVEIGTSENQQAFWATAQWDDDPGYSCAVFYGRLAIVDYPKTNRGMMPLSPGEYRCDFYSVTAYDYLR